MLRNIIMLAIMVFILGWTANSFFVSISALPDAEHASGIVQSIFGSDAIERASPKDRISESQIHVGKDRIIIELQNAEWARFTDTNSMDPVLDYGANAIQIVPASATEIEVGDIISFTTQYAQGTIIHRVVEIGEDEQGWYAITKGDNLKYRDPGKVRFEDVRRVLVAIIY